MHTAVIVWYQKSKSLALVKLTTTWLTSQRPTLQQKNALRAMTMPSKKRKKPLKSASRPSLRRCASLKITPSKYKKMSTECLLRLLKNCILLCKISQAYFKVIVTNCSDNFTRYYSCKSFSSFKVRKLCRLSFYNWTTGTRRLRKLLARLTPKWVRTYSKKRPLLPCRANQFWSIQTLIRNLKTLRHWR